jgi:hypothetical protein
MSFFTSSNNRPSFFGLSQKPSITATTALGSEQTPIIQQPIEAEERTKNDSYFSFGKFSLPSFKSPSPENLPNDSMDLSSNDNQEETSDDFPMEEHKEEIPIPSNPQIEEEGLDNHVVKLEEASTDHDLETNETRQEVAYSSQLNERKENYEKKSEDDGDSLPTSEPKRVKFTTPKLLKIPLKLSSSTQLKQSAKQIHATEPSADTPPKRMVTTHDPVPLLHSSYLPSISEEPLEQMSPGETVTPSRAKEPTRYDSYNYTPQTRTQSSVYRANPVLPTGDDSCEVIVEKIIEIERLVENGTNLYHKVEEKLDTSILELIDQRFR